MLIDAHCHLDDEVFARDLDAVIARAAKAGVAGMVTAGADVASSRVAIALAERYDGVYAAVGIHPHHADSCNAAALAEIRTLARHPKVVAIGEVGLDFHYPKAAPAEIQENCLAAQLDLAEELAKPAVIHDRDAHLALMEVLEGRGRSSPGARGMLHCFSGDLAMAREAIRLGYMISIAGNVTFRNARGLAELIQVLPLDCLVVETDAPYLSPEPKRGRRNEPANVVHVVGKLASIRSVESDALGHVTKQNSESLFGLRIAG